MPGHIRNRGKRSDGSAKWQARWRHPDDPGVRIEKTFRNRDVAKRWVARQDALAHEGMYRDPRPSEETFRALVERWETTRAARLAPKTRERYESITRCYLLPEFGDRRVARLDRPTFIEYFAKLEASGKSPGTVRKVQIVLSSILSTGVELDVIREHPAAKLRLSSPAPREMLFLTHKEVRALADAMPRAVDGLAVYVAAVAGLRAGELWALRRRDVDLLHGRVRVERSLKDHKGRLEFGAPKTAGSRRTVALPAFLRDLLAERLDDMPADPDALVFTAPGGGGARRTSEPGPVRHNLFVRRVFKPAVKGDADNADPAKRREPALPAAKHGLRWHDLRHTAVALAIDSGLHHPAALRARFGHASIRTTIDRYGHLFPSADAGIADGLDEMFTAKPKTEAPAVTPLRPDDEAAAI